MPILRDLRGYGRQRPDIVWPNGARVAVSFVVNFEEGAELSVEEGDGRTEPFGEVQSSQPLGVRDLVQEQVFNYGMRAGLWRFLDAFSEHRIASTFMMCGRAVERVPDLARAAVDAGHEAAVHGWRWLPHSIYADPQTERSDIEKTRAVIASATGATPVGFMCRGSQSPWTRDLITELGFTYDSNALDDDLPYWSGDGRLVILPYGFDTNDMKFFHPNGFVLAAEFSHYVISALDTLLTDAAAGCSSMLSVGLHLRITGRPARFAAVRSILEYIKKLDGNVWVAKRSDIAEHFKSSGIPSLHKDSRM
jgi:peptidoglycan/xylan/chitin deacetylase (PgdA/CDA1 family)